MILFKALTAAYVFMYLYLVLVYGFLQDWPMMVAAALKAVGNAYLVEFLNNKTE